MDCLQSETCQGLKGTYTYDERKSRHLVRDIDGNRILFPSDKLNIVSALVEPIYSSVWSIDQHTFQRFTVLEKIIYEHFWTQLQYRKRGHVSEMMIQNVSEDLLSDPVSEESEESEESDNFTFMMIPLSSGMSEEEMKDRLYNFVNANTIVKKLLAEEELSKYFMNFNDIENTLFKYGISISQINSENFESLQALFQKNIRRYQMEYAKSIKGPRSTEELKTTRLPLTKERRVSLSYDYIFRILAADLRNHYLQKFIDIFTRPADKASESKDYLYNKYTNKKILCRHYLYLVNAKNDNSLFSSMKSIYGLPAADGCIYCNCCGEYLCPEDTSLSDGFSDDKPILLREVMREEAEAALLEKQKYLEKEEALAKFIQIIGNSFGVRGLLFIATRCSQKSVPFESSLSNKTHSSLIFPSFCKSCNFFLNSSGFSSGFLSITAPACHSMGSPSLFFQRKIPNNNHDLYFLSLLSSQAIVNLLHLIN